MIEQLPLRRWQTRGGLEFHGVQSGRGQALVWVHGGFGDWRSFALQWPLFSNHFACIAYSRRCSAPNRNPVPGSDHGVQAEADDLLDLFDAWGLDSAHLVGGSYGAYVALALSACAPSRVRSLVLAEPPVHGMLLDDQAGRLLHLRFMQEVMATAREAFARGDVDAAIDAFTDGISGPGAADSQTAQARARRAENAMAMQVLARSRDPFPALGAAALARVRMPVLLVEGARTTAIHRAVHDRLLRVLPQARRHVIEDASHGSYREQPEAFNRAVLAFLR
jgi:pimeloyl-ACP methyl ester carboxylesterase